MKLVIADEIPIVRIGLKVIAESHNGNRVVAEAGNGREALNQVEKFKPAVLIANFRLAHLNGLELTRQVRELHPETKTIVFSPYANPSDMAEVFESGALGFIDLNSSAADIQQAIQNVNAGKRHPAAPGQATFSPMSLKVENDAPEDGCERLTHREREVLRLAADGHDRTSIAKRLFISQRTVETHRAHFMHKLGLHSQTDLVRFAIRKGILPL